MGTDEIPPQESLQQNSAEVGGQSPEALDQRHDPRLLPEAGQVHAKEAGHGHFQQWGIHKILRSSDFVSIC